MSESIYVVYLFFSLFITLVIFTQGKYHMWELIETLPFQSEITISADMQPPWRLSVWRVLSKCELSQVGLEFVQLVLIIFASS